MLYLVL